MAMSSEKEQAKILSSILLCVKKASAFRFTCFRLKKTQTKTTTHTHTHTHKKKTTTTTTTTTR